MMKNDTNWLNLSILKMQNLPTKLLNFIWLQLRVMDKKINYMLEPTCRFPVNKSTRNHEPQFQHRWTKGNIHTCKRN